MKIQTGSQGNGIEKAGVGSVTSNKFIWVGVQGRIQFVKACALKQFVPSKQILRYESLSSIKGSVENTITVVHLLCRKPGHTFLSCQ